MLVVTFVLALRVTSPALPCSENDWMGWVVLISPSWLVMLILFPWVISVLLLAEELMMPVVMFSLLVISIDPAFPVAVSVLWAEIVPFSAMSEPVFRVMWPPAPVLVVSVNS